MQIGAKGNVGINIGVGLKLGKESVGELFLFSINADYKFDVNTGQIISNKKDSYIMGLSYFVDDYGNYTEWVRVEGSKASLFGMGYDGGEYSIHDDYSNVVRKSDVLLKPQVKNFSIDLMDDRTSLDVNCGMSCIVKVRLGVHISIRK